MYDIITGQFFWGIIVGLVLSFFGGWVIARFTSSLNQKFLKRLVRDFSIDTIRNLQNIVGELDATRDRAKAIHHDFLTLIDVEIGVYGRNREHLIHLPDDVRTSVRKFMNDVAIKRAEIVAKLEQFYRLNALADQIRAEGREPEADRVRDQANLPLADAQRAADKLVAIANSGSEVVAGLSKVKV